MLSTTLSRIDYTPMKGQTAHNTSVLTGQETVRVYPFGNEANHASFLVHIRCDSDVGNLLEVRIPLKVCGWPRDDGGKGRSYTESHVSTD